MKVVLFSLLLLLSLPVLAKREILGLFKVDSSHSKVFKIDGKKTLSGTIEIKENFSASSFKLEADGRAFRSQTIDGDLNEFKISGTVLGPGEATSVDLKGKFVGLIQREDGFEKLVLKLTGKDCEGLVFASRPSTSAIELHETVRKIIATGPDGH
jgi:hypothetical protein